MPKGKESSDGFDTLDTAEKLRSLVDGSGKAAAEEAADAFSRVHRGAKEVEGAVSTWSEEGTGRLRTLAPTGMQLAASASDLLSTVLDSVNIEPGESDLLLSKLANEWGYKIEDRESLAENTDLLKMLKVVGRLQSFIPGSRLLVRHFMKNEFEIMEKPQTKIGAVLKVDLSGFTETLRELEDREGDASSLNARINEDLGQITNFCTQAGFSLASLGGDAATYVCEATKEEPYEVLALKAEALANGISKLSRVNAGDRAGLHHDFKIVAVAGPYTVSPLEIDGSRILRIGGAAISKIDDYEKGLNPGEYKFVDWYEEEHEPRDTVQTVPVLETDETLPAMEVVSDLDLRPESIRLENALEDLIEYLDTFLNSDVDLEQVVQRGIQEQIRENAIVFISLKDLDRASMDEDEFVRRAYDRAKLNNGYVYKVEGDMLIALFPQHVQGNAYVKRAYNFATECRHLVDGGRYAITSGRLLESALGPEGNQELGVLGIAVNRAARIAFKEADLDSVAIDERTYETVQYMVEETLQDEITDRFKGLPSTRFLKVKGLRDLSARPITSVIAAGLADVGVQREDCDAFVQSFADNHALRTQAGVLYVEGASGMGKNLFLSHALSSTGLLDDTASVEYECDLFPKPFAGCAGILESIKVLAPDLFSDKSLSEPAREVCARLMDRAVSFSGSVDAVGFAFIELINLWGEKLREKGGEAKLNLILGKINFWDPPSVVVMKRVHDYFARSGDMKILFVLTQNNSVKDTREEERAEYLESFRSAARAQRGLMTLRPLTSVETTELVVNEVRALGYRFRSVNSAILAYIWKETRGEPARVKTLTGILYKAGVISSKRSPSGESIAVRLERFKARHNYESKGDIALSAIDYMEEVDNPAEVKQFVQIFALLGSAFSMRLLKDIAKGYVGEAFAANLSHSIGVLVSRGILKHDGDKVAFKHSGQRADFRASILNTQRKKWLKEAAANFVSLADTHEVQIAKFHWIQELVETWDGEKVEDEAQRSAYVLQMLELGQAIVEGLVTSPGNQMSVVYYANAVLEKLSPAMPGQSPVDRIMGVKEKVLALDLVSRESFCSLAFDTSEAYLGTSNSDMSNLAEAYCRLVAELTDIPKRKIGAIVGVIRAQIWRERYDIEARNMALRDTSREVQAVSRDLVERSLVEKGDPSVREAYILSQTLLHCLGGMHEPKKQSTEAMQDAIAEVESLILTYSDYLEDNVPLACWLIYVKSRLQYHYALYHVKRDATESLPDWLGRKLPIYREAQLSLIQIGNQVREYEGKADMLRVFPTLVDIFIVNKKAGMSYYHASNAIGLGETREALSAMREAMEAPDHGCEVAQALGIKKAFLQAMEAKTELALLVGDTDAIAKLTEESIGAADMIGDYSSVASARFVQQMAVMEQLFGQKFCAWFLKFLGAPKGIAPDEVPPNVEFKDQLEKNGFLAENSSVIVAFLDSFLVEYASGVDEDSGEFMPTRVKDKDVSNGVRFLAYLVDYPLTGQEFVDDAESYHALSDRDRAAR